MERMQQYQPWIICALLVYIVMMCSRLREEETNILPITMEPYNLTHTLEKIANHNPFESESIDCIIPLLNRTRQVRKYTERRNNSRKCTLEYFNEHFKKTKQFYGEGIWSKTNLQFIPKDCSFTNFTASPRTMAECLSKKNVTRILVTGDSTGRHIHVALMELFKGWSCSKIRTSEAKPYNVSKELEYFAVPIVDESNLVAQFCGHQSTCYSWEYICTSPDENTISLEYISTLRLVDTALSVKKHAITSQYLDAPNKLEYLLRYYLRHHGYPDIWLFDLPFRHESWWSTAERIKLHIDYVLQVLQLLVPSTTKVVFLSDSRECTERLYQPLLDTFRRERGRIRSEELHLENQLFYHSFSQFLPRSSNLFTFLDGMRLTCGLVCDYQSDAAHYHDIYYERLAGYALEAYCAGD